MKIIASNFKTNHTRSSSKEFISKIDSVMKEKNISNEVMIFPSLISLDRFNNLCDKLTVGTQNGYYVPNGSFTGEVGSDQFEEFGIDTILIGHSERRHILGESLSEVVRKFNYYKDLNYKIVYCIGEPLEVFEKGLDDVMEYLDKQLDGIDIDYENLVIAYEPVWAIGTGKVPSIEDIDNIHSTLKKTISKPILYGGSVKVNNIKDIVSIDSVDGVLVGSGSWKVDDFIEMIQV